MPGLSWADWSTEGSRSQGFPQSSLEQLEGLGATTERHSKIMTSSRDQQKFAFRSSFLSKPLQES